MKKLISIALSGLIAFAALTACGDSGTPPAPDNSQPAQSSTETPAAPAEPAAEGEAQTLVFWSIGLKLRDDSGLKMPNELAANQYIKKFEESHPGLKIEVVDQDPDGIHELFKAANLSQNGPDVIGLWSGTATNEYKDFLLPLDKYLSTEDVDSFTGLDLCRVDFQPDGEIIALPYNLTTYNIFYNKELFAKAGIGDDELPQTWDELLALCEKLKAAGVQPFLIGDSSGESCTWITSEFLVDLAGPDEIVNFGSSEFPYDDDRMHQSLSAWMELFGKDYTNPDFVSLGAWDSIQRFVMGEGAMNINGSWAIGEMEPIMGENLGTFKIPAITPDAPFGDYIVSQPGANVSVTSYSRNPDLAAEFVKYITNAEFMAAHHQDNGDLPANNKVDPSVISNPITKESFSWVQENKAAIGFDSIVPVSVATEFYKLAPTLDNGSISIGELIDRLIAVNQ